MQTKKRPCSWEFLFKKNKCACTSIRYTRVLLNSFTFHDKGSFDLWRSFELGNAIKCKILFVFTTSEITAPILSSLPPCRSSGSSRITFLGAFNRKCVWSIKQICDNYCLQFNSRKDSSLSAAQVCYFKTIWLILVVVHVFQPKSGTYIINWYDVSYCCYWNSALVKNLNL